jgi:2-dehydropantoate 2-reductase
MRKVAIVGAGAVGSTIGALLDRAREQVYLIGRTEHVRAIKAQRGLLMDGIKGEYRARIRAAEALDFRPDMVLLTVKTQDVAPTLDAIRPYIEDVPVLTMQNGVRSDELAAGVIGREYLLSSVLRLTCTYLEPGRVTYLEQGGLVIGPPFPECKVRVDDFRNMLTKVIPTTLSSNIRGARWSKLIFNLNNAIPAVTGMDMRHILTDPAIARLSILLMKEGLNVARAAGIALEPLPDTPAVLLRLIGLMPAGIAGRLVGMGFRKNLKRMADAPFYGSTLQSIKRGKRTEIDFLNGEIVAFGQQTGIPAPYNERIVAMVHEVEQTGRFLPPHEMQRRLEG